MSETDRIRSAELPADAAPRTDRRTILPSTSGRLAVAVLLLGLMVVAARLVALRGVLADAPTNAALLRAAMGDAEIRAEALPATPTGVQARALSAAARRAGTPATAEAWLIHGLTDPTSAYLAQFELCRLYWQQGQLARARETCRGSVVSADYWLNLGYLADQRSAFDEALAYFEMAAATDPELTAAWHQLARALFAAQRYEEAVLAYERVMALDPTPVADVYHTLSLSYLALGNPTMARDVLERGLLIYPEQRPYYLNMAETFRAEGDLETADSWYARMLQRWPNDAQAWAARAQTAAEAGRFDDAITYYQEATNNQPEGAGYWMSLAATLAETGQVEAAAEAYRRAMALQPDNLSLWLHAGRFLVESSQRDEARAVFEHVLAMQPENSEAAAQLTELSAPPPP